MSSLRQTSNEYNPENPSPTNMPIKISDAASMVRRRISKNERPYEKEVFTRNNAVVDEWYDKVLVKIADVKTATVPAARIDGCLRYFLEGREILQTQRFKDHLPSYTLETTMFWINFFKNSSMAELHAAGVSVVSSGWLIIQTSIRNHFAQRKWEEIYSQTSDPYDWDKLSNEKVKISNNHDFPFGLRAEDIGEMDAKIKALLENPIMARR